jgi:phage gp45-like
MSIERFIREFSARLDVMVTRAVVNLVNDRMKTQRFQLTILEGETVPDVEHLQPYGLSFGVPAGAEALALAIGGSRSHTVAICAAHPDERPRNAEPRTGGLYTKGEWRLFVDAQGVVHVGAEMAADFIALDGLVRAAIESAIKGHVHSSAAPGSPTGPGTLAGVVPSTAATKAKAT